MEKPQPHGVETLARQPRHRLFGPIHRIPQNRVADVGQVDPDLVGAARLQAATQMGDAGIAGDDLPMCHGLPPPLAHHRHALAVHRMAADGRVDSAAVLPEIAHRQALIRPGQGVVRQLGRQGQVGRVVFGGDNEAAGVPVDAVDNAGTLLAPHAGQALPAVIQQGVDQGPVRVPRRRMHHHPRGLVHHDDVLVLVYHVQGNILGPGFRLLRLRQRHLQHLSRLDPQVLRHRAAPVRNASLLQKPGSGGAGQPLQPPGQQAVRPLPRLLSCHRQPGRFHAFCPSCRIYRIKTGSTRPLKSPPPPRSSRQS